MLEEVTEILNLEVYTHRGARLGYVDNVVVNTDTYEIEEIYLAETNPNIVENAVPITVPFRWIQAIGDIVILKSFPERVDLSPEDRQKMDTEEGSYIPIR